MRRSACLATFGVLALGCGDERAASDAKTGERPATETAAPAPAPSAGPPDAGTRFGHGADDAPADR